MKYGTANEQGFASIVGEDAMMTLRVAGKPIVRSVAELVPDIPETIFKAENKARVDCQEDIPRMDDYIDTGAGRYSRFL